MNKNTYNEKMLDTTTSQTPKLHRNSYSISKKLEVIDVYHSLVKKERTYVNAGLQCNIPPNHVQKWVKNETALRTNTATRLNAKKIHHGMPPMYQDLEARCVDWIKETRAKKFTINYKDIRNKVKRLIKKSSDPSIYNDFRISNTWIHKLITRNHLTQSVIYHLDSIINQLIINIIK